MTSNKKSFDKSLYTIGITIVIITILIIFWIKDQDNYSLIQKHPMDKTTTLQLYQMLYDIDKIFTKYNLQYYMSGGTLLGAVRHNGIIPWDDDADIEMDINNAMKIFVIKDELDELGYTVIPTWFGYKIFRYDGKDIPLCNWKYPFIDIFTIYYDNNNTNFFHKRAQINFAKCTFNINDLFPLKKYKFGEIELYGPNNPIPYLNKCYDKDWNKIAYEQYDHKNERSLYKLKFTLTDADKQPAKPTGPIIR